MNGLRRKYTLGTIPVLGALLFVIFLGSAFAFPGQTGICSASGCHDDPSAISISATPQSITVEAGKEFAILIDVQGETGQNVLYLKYPSDVADNSKFSYVGLDSEGGVSDGDPVDLNTDVDAVTVNYTIIAPDTPGVYTLRAFAAQHTPRSNNVEISVTVIPPAGAGPTILFINATPSIPIDSQDVLVVTNVSSNAAITSVILQYSLDNGTSWENITMNYVDNQWQGVIPRQPNGTLVVYRIVAIDEFGIETVSWELRYTVGEFPQPPSEPVELPQLHFGWLLGGPAIVLAYLGTALEYYDEERFTRIHGIMLSVAYILTTINVLWLFFEDPSIWMFMNPTYLFSLSNISAFVHAWHIWLGIISMIFGTFAFLTHLGGWKTCNLGLPAVVIWTILGITGFYLGTMYRM